MKLQFNPRGCRPKIAVLMLGVSGFLFSLDKQTVLPLQPKNIPPHHHHHFWSKVGDKIEYNLVYRWLGDNFYTVDAGRLYRSRQLSAHAFEKYQTKFDFKTVLNLRGRHIEEEWYRRERAITQKHGIAVVDIGMNVNEWPSLQNFELLMKTFCDASLYPILIHCKNGVDRTGEAAAIFMITMMQGHKNLPIKQRVHFALKQVDLKYGHVHLWHPKKRQFIKEFGTVYFELQDGIPEEKVAYPRALSYAKAAIQSKG